MRSKIPDRVRANCSYRLPQRNDQRVLKKLLRGVRWKMAGFCYDQMDDWCDAKTAAWCFSARLRGDPLLIVPQGHRVAAYLKADY